MIYVGIDVAMEKHDVFIADSNLKRLNSFQISNDIEGFKKLLACVEQCKERCRDPKVRIGLESTCVYAENILKFLSDNFSEVIYINPILTSMFEQSQSIHYAKTDKIDAQGICKFVSSNPELRTYTPVSYHNRQLRTLYREIEKLNNEINKSSNSFQARMHQAFPEFLGKYGTKLGKKAITILKMFPTPHSIKKATATRISKAVTAKRYVNFTVEDAKELKELAARSVGVYDESMDCMISLEVERLELMYRQKKTLIAKVTEILKEHYPKLLAIRGVGPVCLAGIVGEIGNIQNFKNGDSLVALAGLNPVVYQSGKYDAKKTSISKKGSHYLRNALVTLARMMVLHKDAVILNFFNKKRGEGKPYWCAINHCARKLCNIFFTLLKKDVEYIPGYNIGK